MDYDGGGVEADDEATAADPTGNRMSSALDDVVVPLLDWLVVDEQVVMPRPCVVGIDVLGHDSWFSPETPPAPDSTEPPPPLKVLPLHCPCWLCEAGPDRKSKVLPWAMNALNRLAKENPP
ncbi:MAG: hypothetical protein ACYDB3_09360 [Acidimicrobiales bacterium]